MKNQEEARFLIISVGRGENIFTKERTGEAEGSPGSEKPVLIRAIKNRKKRSPHDCAREGKKNFKKGNLDDLLRGKKKTTEGREM